jgi:intracellular sulfur oxidation DsrE/DsrF family protein
MKLKICKPIITVVSIFLLFSVQAQATWHRIVIQLTSSDTLVQKALLQQLKNVTEELDSVQIEVVCHSNGISFLMNGRTRFENEIKNLKEKGVVFAACLNTLKERNIKRDEIIPLAIFVPSGLIEVIKRQEAGWSYIKAGF